VKVIEQVAEQESAELPLLPGPPQDVFHPAAIDLAAEGLLVHLQGARGLLEGKGRAAVEGGGQAARHRQAFGHVCPPSPLLQPGVARHQKSPGATWHTTIPRARHIATTLARSSKIRSGVRPSSSHWAFSTVSARWSPLARVRIGM
jgi:hypothetical protein